MIVPAAVRRSAMYRSHRALNATFLRDGDWEVAGVYTSVAEEVRAARDAAGIADVSALGKLSVRGEALEALVAKVAGLAPPDARRAVTGSLNGSDVLVCRLAPDELWVLTEPSAAAAVEAVLSGACASAGCAHVTDMTSAYAALDLIGPRVPAILARLVPVELTDRAAPPLSVTQAAVAGAHAIVIRLEHACPAFRLLVGREHGEFVWDALLDAGRALGLSPIGAHAHTRVLAVG